MIENKLGFAGPLWLSPVRPSAFGRFESVFMCMSERRLVAGAAARIGCFSGNTTEGPVYFA
jgi:hypothetical protein